LAYTAPVYSLIYKTCDDAGVDAKDGKRPELGDLICAAEAEDLTRAAEAESDAAAVEVSDEVVDIDDEQGGEATSSSASELMTAGAGLGGSLTREVPRGRGEARRVVALVGGVQVVAVGFRVYIQAQDVRSSRS
jgi:hypothetical protein